MANRFYSELLISPTLLNHHQSSLPTLLRHLNRIQLYPPSYPSVTSPPYRPSINMNQSPPAILHANCSELKKHKSAATRKKSAMSLAFFYEVNAFARMMVENSGKLLPAEFYPTWVVFSEHQKLSGQFSFFFRLYIHVYASACTPANWYLVEQEVVGFGHTLQSSRFSYNCMIIPVALAFILLQLTWLNHHLTKIWPVVDEALRQPRSL